MTFFAALAVCWFTVVAAMWIAPYHAPVKEKVVTVFVCSPPEKDRTRMAEGLLLPKLVTTVRYNAGDYPIQSRRKHRR